RLYGQLGLETRFIYVAFRFAEMPGDLPPERWDGRSSMPLVVTPLSRVESTLPPEHEDSRLLGISHRTSLPAAVVRELNAWLEKVRTEGRARGAVLRSR